MYRPRGGARGRPFARGARRSSSPSRATLRPGTRPKGSRGRWHRRTCPRRGCRARRGCRPARTGRRRTTRAPGTPGARPPPSPARSRRPPPCPRRALLGEPPDDAPGPASDVDDAAARRVAQRTRDDLALPHVPEPVERVRRPQDRAIPLRRGARVPVRGDAVDGVARETLAEELPDAGRSGAVGDHGAQGFASSRGPSGS